MRTVQEDITYRIYTADSLHLILGQLGIKTKKITEIMNPEPVETKTAKEMVDERVNRFGLKVVR